MYDKIRDAGCEVKLEQKPYIDRLFSLITDTTDKANYANNRLNNLAGDPPTPTCESIKRQEPFNSSEALIEKLEMLNATMAENNRILVKYIGE